jgi:predicted DNA-binding transcriptional regulator YafY
MRLDRLLSIVIALLGSDRVTTPRLPKVVVAQRHARFTFRNLRGIQIERTVEPMTLLCNGSAWYLFGYYRTKRDYWHFHTGRMQELYRAR